MSHAFLEMFHEKFVKSAIENSLNDLPHLKLERLDIREIQPVKLQPGPQIFDNIESDDANDYDYDSIFVPDVIIKTETEESTNITVHDVEVEEDYGKSHAESSGIGRKVFEGKKSPLTCRYCEKTFSCRSRLTQHERVHTGETPFKCRFCEARFTQTGTRNIHEKLHTGDRPFLCKICNKRFTTRANCKNHLKATHQVLVVSSNTMEQIQTPVSNRNKDTSKEMEQLKPQQCSLCSKSFSRESDFQVHLRTAHKTQTRKSKAQIYKCSHCDQRFVQSYTRNRHEKNMHSDKRPYTVAYVKKHFLMSASVENI